MSERRRTRAAKTPAPEAGEPVATGRVVTSHGAIAIIETATGDLLRCHVLRSVQGVVCGDCVDWQPGQGGDAVIIGRTPRSSSLQRVERGRHKLIAANIDQLLVVMAVQPPINETLIDHYLAVAAHQGLTAHLLVNKSDLLDTGQLQALQDRLETYRRIGYPVLLSSVKSAAGLEALRNDLHAHTSLLVGPSGVGKSSLVKALIPDIDIRIGSLSAASGSGRHTTTTATLYHLSSGGELIDSPGMSEFLPADLPDNALDSCFLEFRPYLGQCRFRDCRHDREPGCAIHAAVAAGKISASRLDGYHALRMTLQAQTN